MIESVLFTSKNGQTMAFNDNYVPFNSFTTEVDWRQESEEKQQEHGLWGSFPYLGKRVMRVEGDLLENTSDDYMLRRLALLGLFDPVEGEKVLGTLAIQFSGIPEIISAEVGLDGYPELPMEALSPSAGRYQIAWKADDPYLYGENQQAIATGPSVGFGRAYSKTYSKVYTTVGVPGIDPDAFNAGNAVSRKTLFVITGPCTNPTVQNLTTGKQFTLEMVIGSGNAVLVDTQAKTVTGNYGSGTEYSAYSQFVGDWIYLRKGTNIIRFLTVDTGNLSVLWQSGYLI